MSGSTRPDDHEDIYVHVGIFLAVRVCMCYFNRS